MPGIVVMSLDIQAMIDGQANGNIPVVVMGYGGVSQQSADCQQ